ncbi:MAG: glycosyltransferase family 1 protein [Bacillus sp. (in: Bacteria)]|nr:glycosyltransferase family 1 protein [Bacillus sp. (in: firmicutes)]MCM1425451.1 glycosyltransferase family 1 protein [Eubacterium sp.]
MTEPIRILHVLGGVGLGGAESRIMDVYRHIDREKVQFDFLIHQTKKGYYEEEIEMLGGRVYRVPRFKLYNIAAYRKALREFFSTHQEYAVVCGHMTSTASIYLPIAKKYGVSVTVAHARSAGVDKGIKGTATRILRSTLPKKCDYMFACSMSAAEAVFGRKNAQSGKVVIVPNAIDAKLFTYDEEVRSCVRKEFSLEDKFVIGHVGRFHYAKNHEYLLSVFQKIVEQRKDAVLLLLGEGERMEEMKERAAALDIADNVIFAGNRGEVWKYYQAMDFFLFPSRFEGLPGTVVEAQSAGLHCLISDTIAGEVKITDLVTAYSIEEAPEKWAQYVLSHDSYERKSRYEQIAAAGFDVKAQAKWYEQFYLYGRLS